MTRDYIQGVHYDNNVGKVFSFASPHKGFPFVILTWEGMICDRLSGRLSAVRRRSSTRSQYMDRSLLLSVTLISSTD